MDTTKPVQTRDGRKAGIYATDGAGTHPIHGWALNKYGQKVLESWTESGVWHPDQTLTGADLVNAPEYPPLPKVEGGHLEYRGIGWNNGGKPCEYWHCERDIWVKGLGPYPASRTLHYAEFIRDRRPYTLETFPMWAVWMKAKHLKYIRRAIALVADEGISTATGRFTSWASLFVEFDIAGTDGIWKPGYEEVSK